MQYNFNVNQLAVYNLGLQDKLDIVDLALFNFLSNFFSSKACNKEFIDGIQYHEVRLSKVSEECPILKINNRETFNKRMHRLTEAGLLVRYPNNQKENKSLYAQGDNYDSMFRSQQQLTPCQRPLTPPVSDDLHPLSATTDTINIPINNNTINHNTYNNIPPQSPQGGDDLSFVGIEFKDAFVRFLEYRREIKKPFKSKKSIEACYRNALQLSDNDPNTFDKVIEQSIANGWQGLFALKTENNGNNTRTSGAASTRTIDGVTYGNAYSGFLKSL